MPNRLFGDSVIYSMYFARNSASNHAGGLTSCTVSGKGEKTEIFMRNTTLTTPLHKTNLLWATNRHRQ